MRNHMFRFFWIFLSVIAAVVVVSVVLNAIFVPRYYPGGTGSYYPGGPMMFGWGYGAFWGFGALMMLIPLALLILFILWIVGITRNHNGMAHFGPPHEGNAMEILNARYASGSITQEEYNRMREDIARK